MTFEKVLVTGATGLVGAHLLCELIDKDMDITAIKRDNSNTTYVENILTHYKPNGQELFKKIKWVNADLTDIIALSEALNGISKVYHAAATVSFLAEDTEEMKKINVEGTANLVNLCLDKGVEKFCHVSSIAALGRTNNHAMVDENTTYCKNVRRSVYARTKYEAEQEVWRAAAEGLNTILVNPSIIIGPGVWHKGSAKLFETVWNGLSFYTEGINGFVDVRDVARIMYLLMESNIKNERFLINAENLPYKTVLCAIADNLGVRRPRYLASPFLSEVAWRAAKAKSFFSRKTPMITRDSAMTAQKKYFYDNKKITDTLNYNFISVKRSIKDTAAFFLKDKGV